MSSLMVGRGRVFPADWQPYFDGPLSTGVTSGGTTGMVVEQGSIAEAAPRRYND